MPSGDIYDYQKYKYKKYQSDKTINGKSSWVSMGSIRSKVRKFVIEL